MALTTDQLHALRIVPLMPGQINKVALAVRMAGVKQTDIVQSTGLVQPYVADVMRGRFGTITVANAHKFAGFFGCAIEDLFPAPPQPAVQEVA